MKLVGSRTSPYTRKIRVMLAEGNVAHDFLEENAWNADTTVPRYNPLNKVPALVLDDGTSIYDSAVIAEYIDATSGGKLIPADLKARARTRTLEVLGSGIADAGILARLERAREVSRQDAKWIERQMAKVDAAIPEVARALGDQPYLGGKHLDLADIACACSLFWLEFRMPELRWREDHPRMGAWAQRMEARASFAATKPPAA